MPGDDILLKTGTESVIDTESAVYLLKKLQQNHNLTNIEKLASDGRKAVWASVNWALPLVHAAGIIPVDVGALWNTHSHESESTGENYFQIPPEFCSMVKVMAGRFHERKPGLINKFLYFAATCQPFADVMDLAKLSGYDVYAIENVTSFKAQDRRSEVLDFLVEELERVTLWLNDGELLPPEKIRAELERRNEVTRKLRTFSDLRRLAPSALSNSVMMRVLMGASHYFGCYDGYSALLDRFTDELRLAADLRTDENDDYIPILFVHNGGASKHYLSLIDEARALVVGWPSAMWDGLYRLDIPPLESVANYLFDAQPLGELGEVAGTSAANRCLQIERELKRTGAKGVVTVSMTGCPYGGVTQKIEREHFERLNIPIVTLESNVHQELPGEEQIMRIKTFFEMLDSVQ
jgi:benzoyl-CoA reductase/2-hydroxyglutaryl-CoA dehydratase subunit BcrC/BadD/HgdB